MPDSRFAPRDGVFSPIDLHTMREAYLMALADEDCGDLLDDQEVLGRIIVRLYRMGLVDPHKLAAAAGFLATSKLFRLPVH